MTSWVCLGYDGNFLTVLEQMLKECVNPHMLPSRHMATFHLFSYISYFFYFMQKNMSASGHS